MVYFTRKVKAIAAMVAVSGMISMEAQEKSLEINVSNITCTDAVVTVTPSDDTFSYYWNMRPRADFDEIGSDNIIANHIASWERNASYYDDTTWQDLMSYSLITGENEAIVSEEYDMLEWGGAEYVVYAFGMSREGEVTVPLTTKSFKTLDPKVSENTFDVKVVSIEPDGKYYMTTTVKITPSNDDPYLVHALEKRLLDYYDLTPGSAGETEFLKNQVMPYGKTYSGEQTVTFTKQRADRDYCVVTVGAEDGAPTTAPDMTEYKTVEMQPEKPVFTIEVTDITQTNAHIKIVPPTEDMLFAWHITTPEVIENHGGIEVVDVEIEQGWWEFVASLYNGQYTWQELMRPTLLQGTIDSHTSDMDEDDRPSMRWDTDMVLYAYGLNEDCERITDIFFVEFKTKECNKSDMTFEFEVFSVELDEKNSTDTRKKYTVAVDILPSVEGEQFAFKYAETKVLDYYMENDEVDDYLFDQFMGYSMFADGYARIIMPEIIEGRDYYMMAIGWDEAPTTELSYFKFNTDSPAVTAVDVMTREKVSVVAVDGGIRMEGDYDNAVVYGIDGKTVGAIRGGYGAVSVPAGVYVVKYEAEGKTVTTKVLVK